MPMPGTVMSISAPSPGARLGELAAIARAEAAIGDAMRYQKAARRAGVDMGLRIRPRA